MRAPLKLVCTAHFSLLVGILGCSGGGESPGGSGGTAGQGGAAGDTGGVPGGSGGSDSGGTAGMGGATGGMGGGASGDGGNGGSDGGSAPWPTDVPSDTSEEGIRAFLEGKQYMSWLFQTDAPRPREYQTSPHDRVRVAFSERLVTAKQAGIDGDPDTYPAGSMAVKEMYDEEDNLVGIAAILKMKDGKGLPTWLYFCDAPDERCVNGRTGPFYGQVSDCNFCHGEFIYTSPPGIE